MEENVKNRNGSIEFLRFVFACVVIVFHAGISAFPMRGGYLGVEFFFILSGVFLGKKLSAKYEDYKNEPIALTLIESRKYLFKRICSIYPQFVISSGIGLVVYLIAQKPSGKQAVIKVLSSFGDLLFLQNFGIKTPSLTGVVWYLSAMFFALWLIYPIVRRNYELVAKYLAPVVSMLIIGFLLNTFGSLEVPNSYAFGFLNTGFLRAVAMILLGIFVNEVSVNLGNLKLSKRMKMIVTGFELFLFVCVFGCMAIWTKELGLADWLVVLSMACGLAIICSGQSCLSYVFNNKIAICLGKLSSVLFLNHLYWILNIRDILVGYGLEYSATTSKLIAILLSFITSLIIFVLSGKIRTIFKKVIAAD